MKKESLGNLSHRILKAREANEIYTFCSSTNKKTVLVNIQLILSIKLTENTYDSMS